jgi:hypothetical protein
MSLMKLSLTRAGVLVAAMMMTTTNLVLVAAPSSVDAAAEEEKKADKPVTATPPATAPAEVTSTAPKSAEARIAELEAKVQTLEKQVQRLTQSAPRTPRVIPSASSAASSRSGGPSDDDRAKFMSFPEDARKRFIDEMRENRERLSSASPEERMKFTRELMAKVVAEEKEKEKARTLDGKANDAKSGDGVKAETASEVNEQGKPKDL